MPYKIVELRKIVIDAPDLTRADLVTMTEAADLLKTSVHQIRNLLDTGQLRTVIDEETMTPHGTPKRYLIRDEVLNLRAEQVKKKRRSE